MNTGAGELNGLILQTVEEQAAYWAERMAAADHTVDEINSFERWLAVNSQHVKAYKVAQQVLCLSSQLHPLRGYVDVSDLDKFRVRNGQTSEDRTGVAWYRSLWAGSIAVAVVVAMAVSLLLINQAGLPNGVYDTGVGEQKELMLDDGSRITLGGRSKLSIDYSANQRRVTLRNGEAFFHITRDRDNPFYLYVAGSLVRVVGTQFNVKRSLQRVSVTVTDGVVEVADRELVAASKTQPSTWDNIPTLNISAATLSAGQEAIATVTGELISVQDVDLRRVGAWREGRLYYERAPLREVVADANRYAKHHIHLATDDLGERLITGSFRTDAIADMLESIKAVLGLEIIQVQGQVLIKTKYQEREST